MKYLNFPIIEIKGEAFDRGIQYGQKAKKYISKAIKLYKGKTIKDNTGWEKLVTFILKFVKIINKYDNETIEEIRGIAEGSNFKFEEILFLN